jgi:hypoxanthine phosphoribosyltransferase
MNNVFNIDPVLNTGNVFQYTYEMLTTYITKVSKGIVAHGYKVLFGIPRGGVTPAIMLSHATGLPVIFGQAVPPIGSFTNLLIVDDIYDTGKTIEHYVDEALLFTDSVGVLCLVYRDLSIYNDYDHFKMYGPHYHDVNLKDRRWVHFPWEDVRNISKECLSK